ncbi:MAG: lamin tail domain-containing protein, partial [Verrucomicrobiota bacterium]
MALLFLAPACRSFAQVRISRVYGGGGSTISKYQRDYIEIYNSSCDAVNIGGWALEYGSATGAWGFSTANIFTFPSGTIIQPKKYLSVVCGAVGSAGTQVPTTDFATTTSGFSMSATSGKV